MPIFKTIYFTILTLIYTSLASSVTAQSTPIHDHHDTVQPTTLATRQTSTASMDGAFAEIDGDHVLGSKNAPVSMIIYASITCTHCASWFNTIWPDVKKNYVEKNKLRVVFREFPTAPTNVAVIGFQIANCAPKDKYFEIIEHQMQEQDNIFTSLKAGIGKETYLAIAQLAGLPDKKAMNTCIQSEAGYDRINKSTALAGAADIHSVPNFIINGKIHKGGQEYLPLAKYLDQAINLGFSPMLK